MATLLSLGLPSPPKATAQPGVSVSFQVFFNSLSPFGRWTNHIQYGSIWIPAVPRDFHPYNTNGRWVMTEYGNTWVSDYEWGWAPFHYGRWFYDDYLGWAWVPDYTWGPGWVNWRTGGGYYGWAPLMPGINIRLAINIPINFWVFVPHRHFMNARWHRYALPPARVTNVYHQTTIINNYYTHNNYEYAYGPRSSDIQKYSNSRVPVYSYSSRGNNGNFRESVTRTNASGTRNAIAARENSLNSRPVATPGSARNSGSVNNNARSSTSARTGTTVTPRSSNPTVVTPSQRGNSDVRRESTPSVRSSVPERSTPANNSPRSREAVSPGRAATSSPAINSRTPINSSERTAPASRNSSRTREATAPARSNSERVISGSRSNARESVSPSRSSSSRQTASPAQRSSPSRTATPARSSSRSSQSERGGR